jgi:eukaryotic-like serine/threonine-protein kinase
MGYDILGIVGTLVGDKYVVEEAVGEGSFSVVYRAVHRIWGLPVALKCFKGFHDAPPETRDRLIEDFVQEGAVLSQLSGRNATIVQARDAGSLCTPDGAVVPYIALEWLEGRTLESILDEERARHGSRGWSFEQAKRVIEPIALALSMVHRRGIAHRDIKPANTWVGGSLDSADMFIKLLDFGVAKVVRNSRKQAFRSTNGVVTSFTPAYGAPEQFSRTLGATGPWTDVYALALLFVELLAGRPAMIGEDMIQLGMAAVDAAHRPTPRALGIPVSDELEKVFARALAVKPYERFADAGEFWDAVRKSERASVMSGERARSGEPASEPSPFVQSLAPHALGAALSRRSGVAPVPGRSPRALVAMAMGALLFGSFLGASAFWSWPAAESSWRALSVHAVSIGRRWSSPASSPARDSSEMAQAARGAACPPEMAAIEGGQFIAGSDSPEADAAERPAHQVALSSYCMDRREVTAGAYKACVDAGRCPRAPMEVSWPGIAPEEKATFSAACNGDDPDRRSHPANCVDFDMAASYCAFAGKRLLTEAEWEVGARGSSAHGVFDISGSVWEWIADWESPYSAVPSVNPKGPATGARHILRGGAFDREALRPRVTSRASDVPSTRSNTYGFRCAQSPTPSP